jgi:CBS domain-containing protein
MNTKIRDVMSTHAISVQPHHTLGHARSLLQKHRIGTLPVIGTEQSAVGIISASDLLGDVSDNAKVSEYMTKRVYCIPEYNDVSAAARVMRKHHIHHVVVTNDKQVCGIISAFDLLALIEDKRFTAKNAPTPKKTR